jgi:hypothetical protein
MRATAAVFRLSGIESAVLSRSIGDEQGRPLSFVQRSHSPPGPWSFSRGRQEQGDAEPGGETADPAHRVVRLRLDPIRAECIVKGVGADRQFRGGDPPGSGAGGFGDGADHEAAVLRDRSRHRGQAREDESKQRAGHQSQVLPVLTNLPVGCGVYMAWSPQ